MHYAGMTQHPQTEISPVDVDSGKGTAYLVVLTLSYRLESI